MRNSRRSTRTSTMNSSSDRSSPLAIPPQSFPYTPSNIIERDGIANKVSKEDERGRKKQIYPLLNNNDDRKKHTSPTPGQHSAADCARKKRALAHVLPQSKEVSKQIHEKMKSGIKIIENGSSLPMDSVVFVDNFKTRSTKHQVGKETSSDGYFAASSKANSSAPSVKLSNKVKKGPKNIVKQKKEFFSGPTPNSSMISASLGHNIDKQQHIQASKKTISGAAITFTNGTNSRSLSKNLTPDSTAVFATENKKSGDSRISTQRRNSGCSSNEEGHNSLSAISAKEILLEKSEKTSLIVPSKCNAKTNSSCVRGIVSNNVVVKKKGFSNSTLKPLSSPHSPNMKFSDDKNPHRFGQKKSLGISSTTKRKHFDATMGCKPVISTHPLNARNSGVNETKNKYSNTPTLAAPSNKKNKITSGTLDYQQAVKKKGLNEGKSSSTNIDATKQTTQNSVLDRNSIKRRVPSSLKEESLSSASGSQKKIESRLSSSLSHEQITETGKEDYMHVMHLSNFEGGFGNCTNDTAFSEQNIVNADKELPDHMYNGLHHHAHDESRVNHKTLTTVSAVVNGPVSRSSMGQTAKNGVHGNATERSKKCESSKIFRDSINVAGQMQKAGNASIKSKYHFSERQTYQSHLPLKENLSQMMTNIETTSSHAEDCLCIAETHQHNHAITGAPHFDGLSNSRESSKNSTFKLMSPSLMCAEDEDAQPHHLNRKRTNSGGIIRQRNEYKVMKKATYSHDTKCESGRAKAKSLSVNKLKMKLFVESCKCHQGLGAERLFAEYWERLGFYLSSMKSTPGNRSSLNFEIGYSNNESKNVLGIESKKETCGIETFLDYFLNSKQLKRLHNLVISALMKQSLSPRLLKSKYVPHIPVKWKRNVRSVPLIADKKCHVNLESSLNAAHDLAAPQHDAGLSYNLERWEETKQDLLEQKESFGIFSGIWNANKDNGRPHPNVITLRNISQGSSNNPILRMKSSDEAVQAALPGSLAVDNIVRKLSRAKGMNVSDSAMWLLTIAVRRQALKVLTNTIKDIIDVGEGVISSTAILELSSKLGSSNFQANELCASKKLSSKGSSMDLLQEESIIINFNKSRKRSSITPLDLAQTIASNPSLFGASFGSSSSRLFYEQCMLSESGKNMQQYDENVSMVTDSDIGQVNALYVNEASPLDHNFRAPHHRQNNQTTANDQDQRCHQEHYQESSRKPEINLPISGKLTSETSSRAVTTAAVTAKKPAASSSTTTPTIISEKKDAHQKEQKKRQFQQTKQQQKKQSRSTKQQREVPQYNKQQNDKPQHKIAKSQSNQQNIKSQSINQQSIQSEHISQHNTKFQPTNQQNPKSQLNSQHSTKPQPVKQQNTKSQLTSQQSIKPQPVNQRNTRSKPMDQQSAKSKPVNQQNGKPQSIKDHNGNALKIKENNGKSQQIKQMREQNKKPLRGCGRGKDLRALIAVRTTDNNLEAVNQPSSVKGESKTTSGLPAKPKNHPTVTRQVSTGSGRGRGKDFSAMRRRRSVPDRVGASTDCVTNSATKIDTSSIDSHGQFQNATHQPRVKGDPAAVNCNLKTNTSASSGRGTGDKQLAKLRRAEENRKKEVQ